MASASVTLPDELDSTFNLHLRQGSIKQSPDQLNARDAPGLAIYFIGQDWRDEAACLGTPTDMFFPPRGEPGEQIRDICFSCPVRLECLQDSVDSMPKFGWRGGHPKEGRVKIRRLMLVEGMDLETADAITLSDALEKVRQRRKDEKTRRFDRQMGEVILGEHVLAS